MTALPDPVFDLGSEIRAERRRRGWTGPELASRVGFSQPKISRLETGRQIPSPNDLERLAGALGVGPTRRRAWVEAARLLQTEVVPWRLVHRAGVAAGQDDVALLESSAACISVHHLCVVPGLLQTPDYARAIIATGTGATGDDLERAVARRIERQRILFDGGRRLRCVLLESALQPGVAGDEVMRAQRLRLTQLAELPGVDIGVIPAGRTLPVVPLNGFVVYDRAAVVVETLVAEMLLRSEADVDAYAAHFEALSSAAEPLASGAPR